MFKERHLCIFYPSCLHECQRATHMCHIHCSFHNGTPSLRWLPSSMEIISQLRLVEFALLTVLLSQMLHVFPCFIHVCDAFPRSVVLRAKDSCTGQLCRYSRLGRALALEMQQVPLPHLNNLQGPPAAASRAASASLTLLPFAPAGAEHPFAPLRGPLHQASLVGLWICLRPANTGTSEVTAASLLLFPAAASLPFGSALSGVSAAFSTCAVAVWVSPCPRDSHSAHAVSLCLSSQLLCAQVTPVPHPLPRPQVAGELFLPSPATSTWPLLGHQ